MCHCWLGISTQRTFGATLNLPATRFKGYVGRVSDSARKINDSWPAGRLSLILLQAWLSCSRFTASVSLNCTERDDRRVSQCLAVLDLMPADASLISCLAWERPAIEDWAEWRMLMGSFDVKCLHKRWCEVYFLYPCVTWDGYGG